MRKIFCAALTLSAAVLFASNANAQFEDWTFVDNEGNGVIWGSIADSGEAGNWATGDGDALSVSSDVFGTADFDTEAISPLIDLSGGDATLTYTANYQNFANEDFLDVDFSTDGGATWTTILSWNEDHGSFRATPGEDVTLALTGGTATSMIRFHYWDPADDDWEWYAQVDDIVVTDDATGSEVYSANFNAIPEPTSAALLGVFALGLVARRRRK